MGEVDLGCGSGNFLALGLRFHSAPAWLSFGTSTGITADSGFSGLQLIQLTRNEGMSHHPALSVMDWDFIFANLSDDAVCTGDPLKWLWVFCCKRECSPEWL